MLRIQGRRRLVQDDDVRVHDQDIGDGDLFFLASAQGVGGLVAEGGDFQNVNDPLHLFPGLLGGDAQIQDAKGDLLVDAGAEQLVVRILEDDADAAAKLQQAFLVVPVFLSLEIQAALLGP